MKVSISTDMEGISGIVDRNYLTPEGVDYERGRRFMTEDINAAIRGVLKAGATEVIVSGGHGANGARNVLVEELHPEAVLISGHTRKYRLQSLDSSYDAVLQIGYHARHGMGGILDHTVSSRHIREIFINGRPIGEIGMNGLVASYHGIPMILVSGDQFVAEDTLEWFPWAETVIVKEAIGRYSARCLHPKKAQRLIEEASERALRNLSQMQTVRLDPPLTGDLQFRLTTHAEAAEDAPGVVRKDSCTVSYTCDDLLELIKTLRMCIRLGGTAEPRITSSRG